jgi:hypothetical protein
MVAVLRIRIRIFLGLLDPDPSIIEQQWVRKTLIPTVLLLFMTFYF